MHWQDERCFECGKPIGDGIGGTLRVDRADGQGSIFFHRACGPRAGAKLVLLAEKAAADHRVN